MDVPQVCFNAQHPIPPSVTQSDTSGLSQHWKDLQTQHPPEKMLQQECPQSNHLQKQSYSGLGLHNLYTEQGISQLQALLLSLWSAGPQHTLTLIAILWAQLLASM